ncbi:MAG: hypothetical protein E7437_07365 [Ruminococcaceae bacterium]|nr:hypothetical protein [Oscillospiraceae bacterium]
MKQLFERTSSCWVRYDKYVIRTDARGTKYITAAADAKPDIFGPLEDAQAMVLEALNVGRLFFGKKAPEREQEAAILRFVHRYGRLGLMTALPTTPKFMQYEKVYLPKNHFIREEALATERYLDYFYPFKKLNICKYKTEFIWEVVSDTDVMALAMTFANDPDAMSMSFQKEYAEPLDWVAKAMKDMTFPFITSKYFYEEANAFDAGEKQLMAQGVAAFGGIAPTYRIALLDKPTIVWDFHSLLIGLQMMFSFMMAEDKTPLRMCDSCDTIFVANRKTQCFCCDKCRRKGE